MIRALFIGILLIGSLFAAMPVEGQIYEDEEITGVGDGWMTGVEEMTLENIAHMVGRLGGFVIGEDPNDPVVGPLMSGLVFALFAIGILGTSKTGLVGGGTLGVATAAVLSQSTGIAPTWVYGIVMMIVGLAAAAIYIRMLR